MSDSKYLIENMTKDELHIAIDWAEKEGWNPGLNDLNCFYQVDPTGFFKGTLNGKIIAIGSAVIYDERFAFCGFYIVDKAYRGQGYGLLLTKARLAYIGNRNAGIDGVIAMLEKYERLGYCIAHNNARYEGQYDMFKPIQCNDILPIKSEFMTQLNQYDRAHFPASRPEFIKHWISQPGGNSFCFWQDKKIKGYGVIRPCKIGYKVGPLFADTPEIATHLLQALVCSVVNGPIFLDIPENNPHAVALVKHFNMKKIFATARMYLKGAPDVALNQVYGITTFELG